MGSIIIFHRFSVGRNSMFQCRWFYSAPQIIKTVLHTTKSRFPSAHLKKNKVNFTVKEKYFFDYWIMLDKNILFCLLFLCTVTDCKNCFDTVFFFSVFLVLNVDQTLVVKSEPCCDPQIYP